MPSYIRFTSTVRTEDARIHSKINSHFALTARLNLITCMHKKKGGRMSQSTNSFSSENKSGWMIVNMLVLPSFSTTLKTKQKKNKKQKTKKQKNKKSKNNNNNNNKKRRRSKHNKCCKRDSKRKGENQTSGKNSSIVSEVVCAPRGHRRMQE